MEFEQAIIEFERQFDPALAPAGVSHYDLASMVDAPLVEPLVADIRPCGNWLQLRAARRIEGVFDATTARLPQVRVRGSRPAQHGSQQRMSRRGNCYDNALPGTTHTDPFWRRFNAELLDGGRFPGLAEAKLEISHYIACYNAERRHSSLGYQAPNHFETPLQTTSHRCPA